MAQRGRQYPHRNLREDDIRVPRTLDHLSGRVEDKNRVYQGEGGRGSKDQWRNLRRSGQESKRYYNREAGRPTPVKLKKRSKGYSRKSKYPIHCARTPMRGTVLMKERPSQTPWRVNGGKKARGRRGTGRPSETEGERKQAKNTLLSANRSTRLIKVGGLTDQKAVRSKT